ncbi:MAG TPA: hypothetical protein VLB67_06660 [Acidimicrobiia bacterium]|nr:hypothetical protein [Acidimicrobiia bacterium]
MRARISLIAACVAAAACGNGADPGTAGPETTTTTTTTTIVTQGSGITLIDTSLGSILADPDGRAIYGFTVDGPGLSRCYDGCAALWPPVPGDTPIGDGLHAERFSVVDRDDGTTQLVMGDWPLYLYAGDAQPGDVNGQGVEGVWFVVDERGELVGAGGEPSSGEAGPTPDPYDY